MKVLSKLKLLFSPTENEDAVNKEYVDDQVALLRTRISQLGDLSQEDLDAIYNTCVSEGSTPESREITDIISAIENIRSGGTATASDILSGKTAYVNKQSVTGTMANKGNVNKKYYRDVTNTGEKNDYSTINLESGYYNNIQIYPYNKIVFMPHLIGTWTNANQTTFNYGENFVGYLSNEIYNTDFSPYLMIAYDCTENKVCDYGIQKDKSTISAINCIYGNISFYIDANQIGTGTDDNETEFSGRAIHIYSTNSNYTSGNIIDVRIYSLSYNTNFPTGL